MNPQPASLPSSPVQGYQCNFYHRNHENASYIITVPLSESACQLQQAEINDFVGKHIGISFPQILYVVIRLFKMSQEYVQTPVITTCRTLLHFIPHHILLLWPISLYIDLMFSLQTTSHAMELFPSSSVLVLHNCSLHTE